MNWIILIIAGMCEVGFTYCLGRAKSVTGTEWYLWIGGFVVFTIVSMVLLAKATYTIPMSIAYPIWTGIGVIGTVIVGVVFFNELITFWKILFTIMLIVSIVGLKLLSE
ncbi:MAG: QacE family quaternary ammonium compound efflux SMR transporter [Paludibacteraceae bacterium]|jgi:quaternary ammonium compound-resistance protein SugE|nr:QacE family quaternary ammonium compound efflux SMR transporter [Paludibacteraceae bacterium]